MVDTIESFVEKLQKQGVQAGQEAASKLETQAQDQAKKIVDDAQAKADKIIADAQKQAQSIVDRGKSELELAARDVVAKLREELSKSLNALLAESTQKTLEDTDFIGKTLHDIVTSYAKADSHHKLTVKINVNEKLRNELKSWALKELGKEVVEQYRPSLNLQGNLKQAGFEYEVSGATVEVTRDSVVESLSELITPALREVLTKAVENK